MPKTTHILASTLLQFSPFLTEWLPAILRIHPGKTRLNQRPIEIADNADYAAPAIPAIFSDLYVFARHCFTGKARCGRPIGLTAFRTVNAIKTDAEALIIGSKNGYAVAISDLDDLACKGMGGGC